MTVGQALWPQQLTDAERAQLSPGIPHDLDRHPDILVVGGGMLGVATARRGTPLGSLGRIAASLAGVATGMEVQSAVVESRRITAVQTSAGEIRPASVVFATGNPPRLDGLDLHLPWSEVKGHMLVTEPTD